VAQINISTNSSGNKHKLLTSAPRYSCQTTRSTLAIRIGAGNPWFCPSAVPRCIQSVIEPVARSYSRSCLYIHTLRVSLWPLRRPLAGFLPANQPHKKPGCPPQGAARRKGIDQQSVHRGSEPLFAVCGKHREPIESRCLSRDSDCKANSKQQITHTGRSCHSKGRSYIHGVLRCLAVSTVKEGLCLLYFVLAFRLLRDQWKDSHQRFPRHVFLPVGAWCVVSGQWSVDSNESVYCVQLSVFSGQCSVVSAGVPRRRRYET
jgi:hypothetical protein